jgi:hypothetical protein
MYSQVVPYGLPPETAPLPLNAANRREHAIYIVWFLVACFGGALRKWFTTSGAVSNMVLLVQMAIPFLMAFWRSNKAVLPFRKFPLLNVFFFYLVLQIWNPYQLTVWHGVLGVVIYGGFWLALFFYLANRHLFDLRQFIKLFFIVAVVEIVLAFVQYQLPTDHVLNRYANMDIIKQIALVGSRVRVTGTFSYLSGFNAYLLFYALMVWAFIRLRFTIWIITTAIIFGFVASFMTGSRSGTLLYLLMVVPVFLKEYPPTMLGKLLFRLLIPGLIGFGVVLLAKKIPLGEVIAEAYENFADRVKQNRSSGEERSRVTGDFEALQNSRFEAPVFGIGTGSTYQGATALFGVSPHVSRFGYVEGESVRVVLEGGIVMVLLRIILVVQMALAFSFTWYIRWVLAFIVLVAAPTVFNVHNAAFFAMGVILVDNIIWRQQLEKTNRAKISKANRIVVAGQTVINTEPNL